MALKKYHKSNNVFMGTYSGFVFTSVSEDPTKYNVNTSTNGKTAVIAVQPNTEYTVHKIDISNRFQVGETPTIPTSSGTLINRIPVEADNVVTFTTRSDTNYIMVYVSTSTEAATPRLMCNLGATALDYEDYYAPYWEDTTYRRYETATETIQSGDTIYANGQPISTYTIKGNTTQSGTPTPSNPVAVNGVGNATTNLFNAYNSWTKRTSADVVDVQDSGATISITTTLFCYTSVDVTANTDYVITCTSSGGIARNIAVYKSTSFTTENLIASLGATGGTFNSGSNTKLYILFYASNNSQSATAIYSDVRLNTGNTAQPFEPYGFKIPILNAQTTNIYLGSTTSTRQIKKYEFTGQETWRAVTEIQQSSTYVYRTTIADIVNIGNVIGYDVLCNVYQVGSYYSAHDQVGMQHSSDRIYVRDAYSTLDDFKNYLQQKYEAGTPVTIWYVLATATTGTVNEPLMKIGDYSDSISNAASIPTTDGANQISIDTTIQPSEFSATWTGWHDSSVKEWDGSDWQ